MRWSTLSLARTHADRHQAGVEHVHHGAELREPRWQIAQAWQQLWFAAADRVCIFLLASFLRSRRRGIRLWVGVCDHGSGTDQVGTRKGHSSLTLARERLPSGSATEEEEALERRPRRLGSFLAAVFDEWRAKDQSMVRVNLFESMFAQLQGKPSMLRTSSPICGKNLAVEHDDRVYSCDHYVYPEHELGALGERSLAELAFSVKQLEFELDKHNRPHSRRRLTGTGLDGDVLIAAQAIAEEAVVVTTNPRHQ